MNTNVRGTVAALALVGLLSGCGLFGGDDSDQKDAKPTATATVDPDRTSPSDLPEVPELDDVVGAVKDVEMGECSTDKGENTVTGTVKNPTENETDYVITVSWITSRSDVVARGVATVENLGGGDEEKWSATGDLAKAGSYSCTLQVQRGNL